MICKYLWLNLQKPHANFMNKLNPVQKTVVGAQFLFVAFGATVLVPLLVGLDPSVALFTAGLGTLIFHAVTKGKVPFSLEAVSHSLLQSSRQLSCMAFLAHCADLLPLVQFTEL